MYIIVHRATDGAALHLNLDHSPGQGPSPAGGTEWMLPPNGAQVIFVRESPEEIRELALDEEDRILARQYEGATGQITPRLEPVTTEITPEPSPPVTPTFGQHGKPGSYHRHEPPHGRR